MAAERPGRLPTGVSPAVRDALLLVTTAARSALRAASPDGPGGATARTGTQQAARAALLELVTVTERLAYADGDRTPPTPTPTPHPRDHAETGHDEGRNAGGPADTATATAASDVEPGWAAPGVPAALTPTGGSAGATKANETEPDAAEPRTAGAGGRDVVWLEHDERRGAVLRAAPLSVSGLLGTRLFAERTVVLTSATLTGPGGFGALARRLGLGEEGWDGVDVGSPFDYRRQGILYVARHLPPPGRAGHGDPVHDELVALVEAAGGRTLGLFSSRRAAEAAAEIVRARCDVPVLCQGDDLVGALVRRFAADESTCLFGTLGLWQGVDVPGPSCSLVVLDRIPFPRPDEPLAQARTEAADAAGASGFLAVSVTHAATLLAQGAGRLIRDTGDRGMVAVLDSRLVTRRYGGALLTGLPDMWRTTDRKVALAALRRLTARDQGRRPARRETR